MPRVLICDKLEAAGLELLKQAGLEVDNRPGLTLAALQEFSPKPLLLRQVPGGLQILAPGRDETIPQPADWQVGYPRAVREALEAYGRGDPPPIPASECASAVRLIFDAYRTAGER